MGAGYVRQSAADIVTGAVVEAAPINAEFNALRDAMAATTGHSHDDTTGEGPKIALTTSISGVLPVANGGFAGIHNVAGTTAPTVNEDSGDGYVVGSHWLDTTNDKIYMCVDSTLTAAVWILVATSAGNQPLDTDLTAIAALTSAADKGLQSTGAGTWALYDLTTFAKTILDDTSASDVRTTLGLAIGTNVQAYDADLTAIAALAVTDGNFIVGDGATWVVESGATVRTSLGLTIGTNVQAYDAALLSIAALGTAADKGIYFTAIDTAAEFDLTAAGRALLDDATADDQLVTLGFTATLTELNYTDGVTSSIQTQLNSKQAADDTLTSIAALGTAADKLAYTTGVDTWAETAITATGRSILDDPTTSAVRDTIGVQGLAELWIPASQFIPQFTSGSVVDVDEYSANVVQDTLAFSSSTQWYANALIALPKRYDLGTITYKAFWTGFSSSGDVVWEMDAYAFGDDDVWDGAYGTAITSTDTFIVAEDLHISPESAALTIAGTPADGDLVRIRISRKAADAGDTYAATSYLLGVKIFYTTDQGNDA